MSENMTSRAEVFRKKQEIEKFRIENDYRKLEESKKRQTQLEGFGLDALEAQKGKEYAMHNIGILERDKHLIRQAVTFISPELSALCPLCPGGVYLMGAISGTGKSTTTAAIALELYRQGKKTFIVSNEETAAKIYARIACAELGYDFNQFIQDRLPDSIRKQVAFKIIEIEPYVTVADDPIGSTTIEPMIKLLREVDESGRYSVVVIDFAQRVVKSIKNPTGERTQILYDFKDALTDYAQTAKVPVILMAQLMSLASDEQDRNVQNRITWAKGLYEAAAAVIEVIKLKGLPVSTFYIAKGRFSKAEVSVSHKFDCGQFTYLSKADLKKLKEDVQMKQLADLVEEIAPDVDEEPTV